MHALFLLLTAAASPALLPAASPALAPSTASAPAAMAAPAPARAGSLAAQDDLEALLAEKASEASESPIEAIFREARAVARILGDEAGAAFDRAVDRQLAAEDLPPRTTLFLVAARLEGDEPDRAALATALGAVLANTDAAAVVAAAELAAATGFDRADEDSRAALAAALVKAAESADRASADRVRCAAAAHQIALGSQVDRPKRLLFEFLQSSDPSVSADAALALASLGVMETVEGVVPVLERVATEPGSAGRLAQAYLKQLQIRRFKDTELRRAYTQREELLTSRGAELTPELRRLEALVEMVSRFHIEGDRVSRDELFEAAMQGLLQRMDPHSSFFNSEAWEKFEQDLEAEYGGIGAYVNVDREDGLFTITRPIYSGPAYQAGLTSDDKIVRVGDWPTLGEESEEVIKRLKGKPGTPVKLYVWRRGMDAALIDRPTEDMAVTVERGVITIPPVHHAMLPGGVGLVELTTFSRVASQEVAMALQELLQAGATSLVLDLRNNTGGLLDEARNVADLFLPAGKTVVTTESRVRRGRTYKTRMAPLVPEELPVAVLINRFSASASEIVSGALQDHGRATLVGQRSYGKGSVQNLLQLPGEEDDGFADENRNGRRDAWEALTNDQDGDGEFDYAPRVKLTIEHYLLPSGRSIHRQLDDEGNLENPGGVEPDLEASSVRYADWRLREMRRVQGERTLKEWAAANFATNESAFQDLAQSDRGDWNAWPGFEELYASLGTTLGRDDIRLLLRIEVRRLVQDARGSAFPMGDFQEDRQLQVAITRLFEAQGRAVDEVPEFALTFQTGEDDDEALPLAMLTGARLEEARQLLARIEVEGRSLSATELGQLRSLLSAADAEAPGESGAPR